MSTSTDKHYYTFQGLQPKFANISYCNIGIQTSFCTPTQRYRLTMSSKFEHNILFTRLKFEVETSQLSPLHMINSNDSLSNITIEACVAGAVAAHLQSQATIVGEKFYGQQDKVAKQSRETTLSKQIAYQYNTTSEIRRGQSIVRTYSPPLH